MKAEGQACPERLQGLIDEIQTLMDFVTSGEAKARAGKEKAREQLRALKGHLAAEHRRMSTRRGQEEMSDAEALYYDPAVHQALTHLSVSVGSVPDQRWFDDLYEARLDLQHMAGQLREQLAE